jgi:hypothetical protein
MMKIRSIGVWIAVEMTAVWASAPNDGRLTGARLNEPLSLARS